MSILKNRGVQVVGFLSLALLLTGAVVDRRANYWGKSSTAAPALLGSNYSTGPGVTAENTSSGYGVQALAKAEMGTALTDVNAYTCLTACDVYLQVIVTGSGKHISDLLTSTGKAAIQISQAY